MRHGLATTWLNFNTSIPTHLLHPEDILTVQVEQYLFNDIDGDHSGK